MNSLKTINLLFLLLFFVEAFSQDISITCETLDPYVLNEPGSVSCSVSGGTGIYSYDSEFTEELFTNQFVEVYAGDYSGTVQDSEGFQAEYSFTITEAEVLVGDLDNDGLVSIVDLTLFLPFWGVTCQCGQDFTQDGQVTSQDLTLLLAIMTD